MKKKTYTADAFFAGVGGIELGFKETKRVKTLYANEFDKNAGITYQLNNPDVNFDSQDIHNVQANSLPDCDIMMGGFPCQAFSIAGYKKGFNDPRGTLFFEMLRMIKEKRPRITFMENVKNLASHDHGNTFFVMIQAMVLNGYYIKWQIMNAKDYGNIPQNRERIYIVGFRNKNDFDRFEFPKPVRRTKKLSDVINFGKKLPEKYYYTPEKNKYYDKLKKAITSQKTVYQWRRKYVRENKSGIVPTLTANMGTGGSNVPLILTDDGRIRKLTPHETFNVQGYPKDFKLPDIANTQLYKQAGNSVVVPVIKRIARNIIKVLDDKEVENALPQGKYVLIHFKIRGKKAGQSYAVSASDDKEAILKMVKLSNIPLYQDEDYFKAIKQDKDNEFYMIKEE